MNTYKGYFYNNIEIDDSVKRVIGFNSKARITTTILSKKYHNGKLRFVKNNRALMTYVTDWLKIPAI